MGGHHVISCIDQEYFPRKRIFGRAKYLKQKNVFLPGITSHESRGAIHQIDEAECDCQEGRCTDLHLRDDQIPFIRFPSVVSSILTIIRCCNRLQPSKEDEFRIIPFIKLFCYSSGVHLRTECNNSGIVCSPALIVFRLHSDNKIEYRIRINFRLFSISFVYQPYTLFHTTIVCNKETYQAKVSGTQHP